MNYKYLKLLAKEYPTVDSVASEMINLSSIRILPKGTEYFFSDLHGEYESFLHMLKSASGMIKVKIDQVLGKTVSGFEREALANLIYYPERTIKKLTASGKINNEWRSLTIYRLILICEAVSAKYTRSKVRKRVPKDLVYILDELLNVTDDINKDFYYDEIINSIIDTDISESFITSLCKLIQSLAIDKLHIIGDIYDRGPRADIIMDELINMHDVDIQWGNHDISWMGAASGNKALVANVIRIAMRYNTFDILEDGYGLNLRALAIFADDVYENDNCELFFPNILDDNKYDPVDAGLVAKMHKAITIIQLKLEGQLIKKHPEWDMVGRNILDRIDFNDYTVELKGKKHQLKDTNFPTIDPADPLKLTAKEEELIDVLTTSILHSDKLHEHISFLFSHGSMYTICNNNLLFHGCIPMDDKGQYMSLTIDETEYSGKRLLDKLNEVAEKAYFGRKNKKNQDECDFMWYLWCGPKSPLFGKDRMCLFERTFIEDKELYTENYNPYYCFSHEENVCDKILTDFGINPAKGHIINGHVPVKIKDGESPVKANGKLFVIDGGISKAYQKATGIAGYTLIFDSHSLNLAEHKPFVPDSTDNTPEIKVVEEMPKRILVADTDVGVRLLEQINDLRTLLAAYRDGTVFGA